MIHTLLPNKLLLQQLRHLHQRRNHKQWYYSFVAKATATTTSTTIKENINRCHSFVGMRSNHLRVRCISFIQGINRSDDYEEKCKPYRHRLRTTSQYLPQQQQRRYLVSWLPEVMQSFSIWGGSGFLLKTIHTNIGLPYWACFAALSVGVRTMLFPLVLYAAHTASRFAKIAPDVQFQLSLFQKDLLHYRTMKANSRQIWYLMRTNMATLGATYKINKVNPLSVFLSPLIQIPIFYYISIDMRKIVNGLDPYLAQNLVESTVLWVPDLTEPDPWFGLPILAGVMLYGNMEIALGRNNLAGGTATSKADMAILLKDLFQSLAVFMPCFTSQLPAGVQIYICTSFCFTFIQSILMRTESFRLLVGLPSILSKPQPGRFTTEMMELKLLEQKAKELRGDGPVLGTGVLIHGWETSFAGKYRPTTIQGSNSTDGATLTQNQQPLVPFRILTAVHKENHLQPQQLQQMDQNYLSSALSGPYIHGISAPLWQLQMQQQEIEKNAYNAIKEMQRSSVNATDATVDTPNEQNREYIAQYTDDIMEKANRGERPVQVPDITIVDKPIRGVPYKPLQLNKKQQQHGAKPKKRR